MLLIFCILIAVIAIVAVRRFRDHGSDVQLGFMSEQWVAEYRAANPA